MTSKVQPASDYWTVDRENLGMILGTFRTEDEDDYEYKFSVLSMRIGFGGLYFSKCDCAQNRKLVLVVVLILRSKGPYYVIFSEQKNKERNDGEIFWMNNKGIIEFGFRRIWRILQISEGIFHLDLQPLWITPSLFCRILHILLGLIQIAN